MSRRSLYYARYLPRQVHLALARYHELGRFSEDKQQADGSFDHMAALFHLKCAADCGLVEGMTTLAHMYYDMPHDLLAEVSPPEKDELQRRTIGFCYMEQAAHAGDRSSMVFVARALDTGMNLDAPGKERSAKEALGWCVVMANAVVSYR